MTMEIQVMQGADVFAQMFNAVATFVKNETWHSLMTIAEIIGVFAVMIAYIKGRNLKDIGMWFLTFILVNTLLLTPKERLIITDLSQPNIIKNVDNVPLGVAFPIYFTTMIGNAIARTYDTFLAQPDDLQYTQTGLLFGQRLLEHSFDTGSPSPELASNINNFVKQCLIERNMISKEFSWSSLMKSSSLVNYFSMGKAADSMTYTTDSSSSIVDCKTAGVMIHNAIIQEKNNQRTGFVNELAQKLGISGMLNGSSLPLLNSRIASVQNYFMGTSKAASDIYVQNMLVNQFRKAMNSYPANLDASSVLISQTEAQSLTKMKLSHLSSYQVSSRLLPALHTVLLVLMVGLFPIMVLAMFVREVAWGVVKNYLTILFSLMMWPVMFAIFNSIMNTLSYQTLNGQSFTLSNANTLKENASTMAGVAMWLTTAIPFLSFKLVTSLGQNIASAGSYLGNAMSSTTNADAAQTAMGNYNWGNMQTNNYQGNKTDLNHLYRVGQSTFQNDDGSLGVTTANGSYTHQIGEGKSTLSFNVTQSDRVSGNLGERIAFSFDQSAKTASGAQKYIDRASSTINSFMSGNTTQTQSGKITTDTDGYTHQDMRGDGKNVDTTNRATDTQSNSRNSQSGVSDHLTVGLSGMGSSIGVTGSRSDNTNALSQKEAADVRAVQQGLTKGENLTKLDGTMTQIINGTTNVALKQAMTTAQNELREGMRRYEEYTESKGKTVSETKDYVVSKMQEQAVVTELNQKVVDYMTANYSNEERMLALAANPTEKGLELRNQAIQSARTDFENSLIEEKLAQKARLYGQYANTDVGGISNSEMSMPYNNSGARGERENNISQAPVNTSKMGGDNHSSSRAKQYEKDFNEWDRRFRTAEKVNNYIIEEDKKDIRNKNSNVAPGLKETRNALNNYHNDGW